MGHYPYSSQAYKEGSWTSFEVKMGFIPRIWKYGRWIVSRKKWAWMTIWIFFKYNTWRKGCMRNCHVLFLWPIKFTRKMSIVLVWSTRWEQLNSWASPHILMPNYANYNKPTTLHLEHVNFSIFLITCMQNIPYKLKSPFVKLNDLCEHKGHFYMNI